MKNNHSPTKKQALHSFMEQSCISDECPISSLAQDHFFSILLLLPINSIVSFALTCKKFNSLSSSDTLWESICRRDWGPSCVDALKSSYFCDNGGTHLPWLKLYQQMVQLGSVSCYKLSDPVADELVPNPRASHSLNFVSNCVVLFGGGSEGGRHLDDTWIAYLDYGFRTVLKWQKLTSGSPSGRFGHTCEVSDDSLILFGGINDHGSRLNDTWIGKISQCETLGITLFWTPLDVGSTKPPARGAHAGCCIENRRMLIHGGIGLDGLRLGDMWILEISENFCRGTWHEVQIHPSPPARSGHTLTNIDRTRTVLFGGRGSGYDVLEDVWLFDVSEGYPKWVQVLLNLQNIPGGISLPRVGHSATLILGGRLLIYGGEDSERRRKDDFWLLDVNPITAIKVHPVSTSSMALLTRMWRRLKIDGYKPNSRSFHAACADHSGRYIFVFGGMVDGLLQPASSSGLGFDSELLLVELCFTLS